MPRFESFDEAWRWFEAGGEPVVSDDAWAESWTRGRAQYLTFLAPVTDATVVAELGRMREALAAVPGVAPFSDDYLHISLLPLGFQVVRKTNTDEVTPDEASLLAQRAAPALRAQPPLAVSLGPVNLLTDAIACQVTDGDRWTALAVALAAELGREPPGRLLPHVTIAACHQPVDRDVLLDIMRALRAAHPRVPFAIRRIELTRAWLLGDFPREEPELEPVRSYLLRG